MKVSEYIVLLQGLQRRHGDLEVVEPVPHGPMYAVTEARPPQMDRLRPMKPREQYRKVARDDDNYEDKVIIL